MFYCPKCKVLCNEECPKCGSKNLVFPTDTTEVFLISKDFLGAAIVEDILNEHRLPFLKTGEMGAGLTAKIGIFNETFSFYVPYPLFERAKLLLDEFLPSETVGLCDENITDTKF